MVKKNKADPEKKKAIERYQDLLKKREHMLSLPPENALDYILSAPQPAALVHSFPEEDFHFLVHDIGPEDSLQLLSLASHKQLEFILDIETWEQDRIDSNAVTKWLDLFLKSDPKRFMEHFLDEKIEFVELYLFKNIEVAIREHDQEPSVFNDEYFTFDDTFYVRFVDYPYESESGKKKKMRRKEFLSQFLKRLAAHDHIKYQQLILEAASIIPAETEEESYRLRNVRLAERGFLPFDEAVGMYQHLDSRNLEKRSVKTVATEHDEVPHLPVPFYSTHMLKKESLFAGALNVIDRYEKFQEIQSEFAGLCNRIVSADQKKIRERDELRASVSKACGYLSIGLEHMAGFSHKPTTNFINESAVLITKYPLSEIFRVGFGLALDLKWRAEKWRKESWFVKKGLTLGFWGEYWLGVLGGLLLKKPLFYDNYQTGVLYREFLSMDDIKETGKILNEIMAFDGLLALMDLDNRSVPDSALLTHKSLVLTTWAKSRLGLSAETGPIPLDVFRPFYTDLWTCNKKPRKIKLSVKEAFLSWISGRTGLKHVEISETMGALFEALFNEIEDEYGNVSDKNLDPKLMSLFFLKNQQQRN